MTRRDDLREHLQGPLLSELDSPAAWPSALCAQALAVSTPRTALSLEAGSHYPISERLMYNV